MSGRKYTETPVTKDPTPIDAPMRAAELLAEGVKFQDIAAELGVSRMTVWRWFRREDVTSYYLALVNMKIAVLKDSAVKFLDDALNNDVECPHAVKHAIARTILERCDKLEAVRDRTIGSDVSDDKPAAIPANPWAFLKKAE